MIDSVLNRVLMQCRNALLSGIPIIYIKTDSDVFIHKLVMCEKSPLVVLLSNGGRQNNESERELKVGRPLYELAEYQDRQLIFCRNYKNGIPMDSAGTYRATPSSLIQEPFLWVYKMPDPSNEANKSVLEKYYTSLESYVVNHENPNHPQYKFLQSSIVILYSAHPTLPAMLSTYTEFIDVDYPDEAEIRSLIKTKVSGISTLTENENYLSALCTDFLGFTTEEIELTMRKIIATSSFENTVQVEKIINEHKRQKMQDGLLEQCSTNGNIGGMSNFQTWLRTQIDPLRNSNVYMRKNGTLPPKGVLLCGIPGCGKSEAAKFTAQVLNLPLLKMDMGSLMDKYLGGSEQKMRDALKLAEAMSPCVLWIDELEKGFSGASSDNDSASFKRMFGYMLSWMQDNTKPCFIFATANDIGGLPKEFFRSGRFDALYAVYLPTSAECIDIFRACMNKAVNNIARITKISINNVNLFHKSCYADSIFKNILDDLFVRENKPRIIIGSDIQKLVNLALRKLSKEKQISGEIWEDTLRNIVNEPTFCVYGDGEENIDSIALSYCRMLRKGFISASSDTLFRNEDYHPENAEFYERLKSKDTENMTPDELKKHNQKLAEYEIMQGKIIRSTTKYDSAVYSFIKERINAIAFLLEKHERNIMIKR